jgi:Flp pilus assembly protein TadD
LKGDRESLEEAAQALEQATRLAPGDARGFERLGAVYMQLDVPEKARPAFERAFQLNPSGPYAVQQLAMIYRRAGENKLAEAASKQAEALTYNERLMRQLQRVGAAHPENWKIQLTLARRYREIGWGPQAEQAYEAVLHLQPNQKDAAQELAAMRRDAFQGTHP